jgi:predicted metal-binding membrane protein
MPSGMPMPGGWTMSMAWMRMPDQSWPAAAAIFLAMWAAMMIAMMLPSFAPVVMRHRRPLRVAVGYFAVWIAAGAAVYPIGIAIAAAAMRWPEVARAMPIAIGAAIALAGVLQLSRWKASALSDCRNPACCALGHRPGPREAWRDGLRFGAHCLRCCGPAMLVLLATGVMNVVAMAAVTVAITLERLLPRPRLVRRALGVGAIAGGLAVVAIQWTR